MTLLREKLERAFSNNPQRIVTFSGLLERHEIILLRTQNDTNILGQAEQTGRITKIKESYTVWRNWLSRRNMDMQSLINKLFP